MGPETMADLDPRPLPHPHRSSRPPPPALLLQMTRAFLWVCMLTCVAGAVLLAMTVAPQGRGLAYAVAYGALALAALAAARLPDAWIGFALGVVLAVLTVALAATTLALQWSLAASALPVAGLMVCILCTVAGWRAGAMLATVAALCVVYVGIAAPLPPAGSPMPALPLQLGINLIAIASGLACGVMVSRVMGRYMRSAHEREERFRRLLALAADAYWELDTRYRIVAAADHRGELPAPLPGHGLGVVPWELPQFGCDPETLDELQADLDTRVPFRDRPLRWTEGDGTVRSFLVSGEPRFDERGVFTGYWGVARDVTAVEQAHDALAATETRYQELFSRIPSPLVLHRGGFVIDANPAALALFGHDDLATLQGADLLAMYESGDSRERARRRMEQLNGQAPGTALPVADFRLLVGGRQLSVRATSVRVDADGGPAILAIFVDDTERLAVEEAVRRSEALLSHLVATSPDLITLSDIDTRRFAMVNHSFERASGWSAAEAVGRSGEELGLWASDAQRDHFFQTMATQGSISDLPMQFISRSGKPVSVLVSAARFMMDRREYVVVNARDVTERERQRLLREAILDNASIGIAVTRHQRFVLVNRHFEQIYGWGPGELIGQSGSAVWSSEADYVDIGILARPVLERGEPLEIERVGRRKDGSTLIARVRGRAIDPASREGRRASGTVWIVEDVTERRQAELALARARDEAEAANRAKSAFLANTSHELRTPLNGMIGLARLARDEGLDDARRRQYLDQIAHSAQSLAAIISDILDLSKIEAGKLQLEVAAFDLGAELQQLQRSYATLAQAHGLELRLEAAPGTEGFVQGDALRVRQILSNYLGNAIKFTERGQVLLGASRLGDRVRFEVQDTGAGIDETTRARLFKPFTQADESTTRRFGGTGLGLSICRELATLMGGTVGVTSRVGSGSTFWAELPLPSVAAPQPRATEPAPAAALAGRRVLMVEDNPVNMMIAVAMLERWGVEVAQAHDGQEAIAAVRQAAADGRPFDAVLMDVQMPVMSGHEATRALREAGHSQPIIALTAAALVTERETALRAGMNDFLTKPIEPAALRATLARWTCPPGGAKLAS